MSAFYDKARKAFADGDIHWLTDNIKPVLVDTGAYTVDLVNHDFLDDIPVGARVAAATTNLTAKDSTAGVLDAADIVVSNDLATSAEAIVLYVDTGTAATSRLICFIDSATGLPVPATTQDVTIQWDNGTNKIGKL
jgi:hypothetical protein